MASLYLGVSGTGRLINPADDPLKDPEILSKGWGPPLGPAAGRETLAIGEYFDVCEESPSCILMGRIRFVIGQLLL